MMRTFLFAVSAVIVGALMVPFIVLPRPSYATIVIQDDGGGMVGDYLKFYQMVRAAGIRIRVEGACISACTLLLSLPASEVCMLPGSKLGFHLARDENGLNRELTAELVKRFYPPPVQKWIERNGPLRDAPIYMSGEEAVSLGVVQPCI